MKFLQAFILPAAVLLAFAAPVLRGAETWCVGPVNGTTQLLHNGKVLRGALDCRLYECGVWPIAMRSNAIQLH